MGVILTKHVTDDTGALLERGVGPESHFKHVKEDSSVDRLQTVTDIGQSPADNDRHGIVEIRGTHLLGHVHANRPAFVYFFHDSILS